MTDDEYETWCSYRNLEDGYWKIQNEALENRKKKLTTKMEDLKKKKDILEHKKNIVDSENVKLNEFWNEFQTSAFDSRRDLIRKISEAKEMFFNVKCGKPAVARSKTLKVNSNECVLVIEKAEKIKSTCKFHKADIYTSSHTDGLSKGVQFAIFYEKKDGPGYHIRSLSESYKLMNGLNSVSFGAPLSANKGDYYGLILHEGASVDYDALKLGGFHMVKFLKEPDLYNPKFSLKMDGSHKEIVSPESGMMDFSFMMIGTE